MLIAIYECDSSKAARELMENLDPGESMTVVLTAKGKFLVSYESKFLQMVAIDTGIVGCRLVSQEFIPNNIIQ